MHILDGCSFKITGEDEGFGEKRICHACFVNKSTFELYAEENWRGETKKIKKRQNYLKKDPTILFYNDESKTKSPVIGIIKNGSRSNQKSLQVDGKHYIYYI